jgi:hypothetical protein
MTCSRFDVSALLLLERADDVSSMQIDFIPQFNNILLFSISPRSPLGTDR